MERKMIYLEFYLSLQHSCWKQWKTPADVGSLISLVTLLTITYFWYLLIDMNKSIFYCFVVRHCDIIALRWKIFPYDEMAMLWVLFRRRKYLPSSVQAIKHLQTEIPETEKVVFAGLIGLLGSNVILQIGWTNLGYQAYITFLRQHYSALSQSEYFAIVSWWVTIWETGNSLTSYSAY